MQNNFRLSICLFSLISTTTYSSDTEKYASKYVRKMIMNQKPQVNNTNNLARNAQRFKDTTGYVSAQQPLIQEEDQMKKRSGFFCFCSCTAED